MSVVDSRMKEFIELYRSLPCLWDRMHSSYKRRMKRQEALKALLVKYREIEPEACLRKVHSKIEILRNGFIRELKKVRMSKASNKQYIPTLWYYNSLKFLEDQYSPRSSRADCRASNSSETHCDSDEESHLNEDYEYQVKAEFSNENSNSSVDHYEIPTERRQIELDENSEIQENSSTLVYQEVSSADCECIGKYLALQMKGLEPHQSAIAFKLISDTIFYAKLGKLNLDSHVAINPSEADIHMYDS